VSICTNPCELVDRVDGDEGSLEGAGCVIRSSAQVDEVLWDIGCVVCSAPHVVFDSSAGALRLGMEGARHELYRKRRGKRQSENFMVKIVSLGKVDIVEEPL